MTRGGQGARQVRRAVVALVTSALAPLAFAEVAAAFDVARLCHRSTVGASSPVGTTPCPGVRPGAIVVISPAPVLQGTAPDGFCTLGFLIDAAGRRYISTAGHCAGVERGQEMTWAPGDGQVVFDRDRRPIGEFAYAARSEAGAVVDIDLALIRLAPGVAADPTVCHFGGPTGIDDRVVARGEPVVLRYYGNTFAGGYAPGASTWLLPARTGVSDGMPSPTTLLFSGHASFADSGAPILSADGKAVALISGPGRVEQDGYSGLVHAPRLTPQLRRAEAVLGVPLSLVRG